MSTSMNVITVGGPPGSGTSTLCRLLEKDFGMRYVYVGQIFRTLAKDMGMGLEEFGKYAQEHPEIDRELDRRAVAIAREGNVILEGRLAGYMVHRSGIDAFKIWVDADLNVRSKRVASRDGISVDEALKRVKERENDERTRYMEIYGIDLAAMDIYDLVIDSTTLSPEEIEKKVLFHYRYWKGIDKKV